MRQRFTKSSPLLAVQAIALPRAVLGGACDPAGIDERSVLAMFRLIHPFPWSSTMKTSLLSFAVAFAVTGLTCGTALAQFYNDDYTNTTGTTAYSLDLTFSGSQTGNLAGETFVYAFPWPNSGTTIEAQLPYNGSPYNANGITVSDSYDPGTNTTTLVYSGTYGLASGATAHVGYGLAGGSNGGENTQSPAFLGSSWDVGGGTLLPANPVLTETISGAGTLNTSGTQATTFMLLHANVASAAGGTPVGQWAEFQVPTNAMGTPLFENDGTAPVTLSNVGYQLSSTLIPLDQLNSIDEPASYFTPLGIPDGTTLGPGQSVVPEPGTIVLLGVGAIGVAAYAWQRRRRAKA